MAWIRQLDSGLWAATIYLPPGSKPNRLTDSHENKKVIENWAKEQEAAIARGNWIDPRLGAITVGELWELWGDGRRLAKASRKRDASHWANWVGPRWADVAIGTILKPDVTKWIVGLERRGREKGSTEDPVGGWTVIASLALLRSLLEIAVDARLIHFNPSRGVKTAPSPKHVDRTLTDDECDALIANFYARFPGLAEAGLFVEMMAYTGARYEELAALARTAEAINTRAQLVHYRPVMEKDGTIKEYPKSEAGDRDVPVDDDLWPRFHEHVLTVPPGALVFKAPGGGPLLYDNWLKRTWKRGLLRERPMTPQEIDEWKAARVAARQRPWKAKWVVEAPVVEDPQPTPHDLRHLFGTRLSEAGIPGHERMALMGHDDTRSSKRYENARPGRFDSAKAAMLKFRRSST